MGRTLKSIAVVSVLLFGFSDAVCGGETCYMVMENGRLLIEQGNCDKRYPPFCTFNIVIGLMGFETEVLADLHTPCLEFKDGYTDFIKAWRQPHDPMRWMSKSCVWYAQEVAKKIGQVRFTEYVQRLHYGNMDTSGEPGRDNGLTHCWLGNSLLISPREQVCFLEKFACNTLPVNQRAHELTQCILFVEHLPNGWALYGKTGNGLQLDDHGGQLKDRQMGWFVGFLRKGQRRVTFAYVLLDDEKHEEFASVRAKAALRQRLPHILDQLDRVA